MTSGRVARGDLTAEGKLYSGQRAFQSPEMC